MLTPSRYPVKFPGAVLLVGLCGACRGEFAPGDGSTTSIDAAMETPAGRQEKEIDLSTLAPGDTLLGLRIESIVVQPETVDSFGWTGHLRLLGPIMLSGEYRPHPLYPEVEELCFFPDPDSAARLPRFPNDERTSWLCFTNQAEARQWLGDPPVEGRATIVIGEFDYRYQHTDVYNTARLERVVERL